MFSHVPTPSHRRPLPAVDDSFSLGSPSRSSTMDFDLPADPSFIRTYFRQPKQQGFQSGRAWTTTYSTCVDDESDYRMTSLSPIEQAYKDLISKEDTTNVCIEPSPTKNTPEEDDEDNTISSSLPSAQEPHQATSWKFKHCSTSKKSENPLPTRCERHRMLSSLLESPAFRGLLAVWSRICGPKFYDRPAIASQQLSEAEGSTSVYDAGGVLWLRTTSFHGHA